MGLGTSLFVACAILPTEASGTPIATTTTIATPTSSTSLRASSASSYATADSLAYSYSYSYASSISASSSSSSSFSSSFSVSSSSFSLSTPSSSSLPPASQPHTASASSPAVDASTALFASNQTRRPTSNSSMSSSKTHSNSSSSSSSSTPLSRPTQAQEQSPQTNAVDTSQIASPSASVGPLTSDLRREFRVAHYNILASYAGRNKEPWFLHPLNLTEDRRQRILQKFYEQDATGQYVHGPQDRFGFELSLEEMETVEAHEVDFDWGSRQPKLLRKIWGLEADILSIVELDHYEEFRAELESVYESAFARRPRRSSADGSALFWRRERYEVVRSPINVTFADWEPRRGESHREDRVMLAVALRERQALPGSRPKTLVAAALHLMRNPEDTGRDAMRMLEVSQMMRALSCFVAEVGAEGLIVMGDFNAVPQSWTHLFALHGWQDCMGSEKKMKDAFDSIEWGPQDKACTSRTAARSMWIDYIFYSARTMKLKGPPEVERCPPSPIPNADHPSDHIPVLATLRFRAGAQPLDQRARGPEEASCSGSPTSDEGDDIDFDMDSEDLDGDVVAIGTGSSPRQGAEGRDPSHGSGGGSCDSPPPVDLRNASRPRTSAT